MLKHSMFLLCLVFASGCTTLNCASCASCNDKCKEPERHKTLFEWAILADDKEKKENGEEKKENEDSDPRSKPLASDRPDFTESSTTVGNGVVQFEGGYTYTRDRVGNTTTSSNSYPQGLFRIGLFEDWFELRIGQDFANNRATGDVNERINGAQDTYLGVKLALTEQKKFLPEMALILQATIPTGQQDLTADRVLPGFNLCFGWDIIKDKIDLGGTFSANKAVSEIGNSYVEIGSSLSVNYTLTQQLGAFTEFYGIMPSGSQSPIIGPQYYFDGGFTYKFTYNIQFDINAGVGLNRHANDYFVGSGIVLRF